MRLYCGMTTRSRRQCPRLWKSRLWTPTCSANKKELPSMWKEFVIVLAMYLTVLAGHAIHTRYARWLKAREEGKKWADALNPYSPLHQEARADEGVFYKCCKHGGALGVAVLAHPVTGETIKGYVIHLLVYSG